MFFPVSIMSIHNNGNVGRLKLVKMTLSDLKCWFVEGKISMDALDALELSYHIKQL